MAFPSPALAPSGKNWLLWFWKWDQVAKPSGAAPTEVVFLLSLTGGVWA